jgi:hypothetical protein
MEIPPLVLVISKAAQRRGRIVGQPPLLENVGLARYSTGLFNGEGYSYCKRRKRRIGVSISPTIVITMCDRDALDPVARWWSLPVRKRGGKAKTCVDGQAHRVEASGLRARLIVDKMIESGLSDRKRTQWEKVLSEYDRNVGLVPR